MYLDINQKKYQLLKERIEQAGIPYKMRQYQLPEDKEPHMILDFGENKKDLALQIYKIYIKVCDDVGEPRVPATRMEKIALEKAKEEIAQEERRYNGLNKRF